MLNVAILIERAEIGLGGAERSVSELTAELNRQGVAATILAAKGAPAENTKILCGNYAGKRVPLKVFEKAIQQHLENNPYDIIHSTLPLTIADIYQPRGGSYREAMLQNIASYPCSCQRFAKRWTHWLNLKRTQHLLAEKRICSPGSGVVIAALSRYVKEQFQRHYHLPDNRIAVIPNGIHTQLRPDEKTAHQIKETILKSISIPAGKQPVLFLFAANNPRLKGLRESIVSMCFLTKTCKMHPILIVTGIKGLGQYNRIVSQHNLKNHIVSLGPQNSIANVLSACDIAVLPTHYDPCSRFILEALAMGKPVITTRFNGASERYENLRHGIVLEKSVSIPELTKALCYFCDREKIELAGKAILDDNLKEDVSIAKHVRALIELYDKIITQKEKAR